MTRPNDVRAWHCLFEQSGTFRDVLRNAGYLSEDYDIVDNGTTDIVIDLFMVIRSDYDKLHDDYYEGPYWFSRFVGCGIIAFFPCVRFSTQSRMYVACKNFGDIKRQDDDKCEMTVSRLHDVFYFYSVLCKLVYVCYHFNIPLIIENPYFDNMLRWYFPWTPWFIDLDRSKHGDSFRKPTMFYVFNFEPFHNMFFMPQFNSCKDNLVVKKHGIDRSLISPLYAAWFVSSFLLPSDFPGMGKFLEIYLDNDGGAN